MVSRLNQRRVFVRYGRPHLTPLPAAQAISSSKCWLPPFWLWATGTDKKVKMKFVNLLRRFRLWRINRIIKKQQPQWAELNWINWDAISGDIKICLTSPEFGILMDFIHGMFTSFQAENYLSFTLADSKGVLEFIIQRPDKLTPAQKNNKLTAEIKALQEKLDGVSSDLDAPFFVARDEYRGSVWGEGEYQQATAEADRLFYLVKELVSAGTTDERIALWLELFRAARVTK